MAGWYDATKDLVELKKRLESMSLGFEKPLPKQEYPGEAQRKRIRAEERQGLTKFRW